MKKNLFLAGALALFSFVGVSAQDWCHTIVNGLPGTDVKTTMEDGTEVTNRYAETQVFSHAGTKSIRMTVLQTGSTNQIKGGGPTWNLAELKIYDGNGKEIAYTATSNADHNTMGGAGNDGAGLPALNDDNLNNYWHSTWSAQAPNEYHYLEFELAETVDAFSLAWWNRPNNNNNCPIVVGLTPGGKYFTEDMKFSEYGFELGEQVTSADELVAGTFAFYLEGEEDLSSYGDYTGNGNTFVSLSGYTTGKATTAGPEHIVQFIPTQDGKFVLYQPVLGTYYANPDRWTDGYNGKNGWLRAYSEGWTLAQFEITKRADGDFEITTELTHQYVDGAWVDYDTPLKVWVGYDMRGNLKIFPQTVKEGLEQGDYTQGFGLPVDFGFTIYNASVNKEMVPDLTADQMCESILRNTINIAAEKQEEYADVIAEYDWDGAADELAIALDAANEAVNNGDLAGAFAAKSELEAAISKLVAQKANYYEELHGELETEVGDNMAEEPYTQDQTGMYTKASEEVLAQISNLFKEVQNNYANLSYSQIEAIYAQIESLLESLEGTKLAFTEFPAIVEDIPADNFPYSELPNNAVWKKNVVLAQKTNGIRLTFLDRHRGNANDPGNFPMIAIGELKIYDGDGNEVTMAAENFEANYTETQEGFESTVARLCDGNFAAQGYYHSPWSGNEPQVYIYIDITFPESMDNFSFEVYSRDKSTSGNQVSLFPKKVAITKVGEGYDPLLFAENPYNVKVVEKVTSVDQLTADGLYVIKGLLNTNAVYKEVTVGEGTEAVKEIQLVEPEGTAMFYHGTDRFHANAAAVRAAGVYRFVPNGDGTFKALSLGLGKYWPSTEETGFVGNKSTYEADKAAKLNIVASTNIEGAFVMYEKIEGLTTQADSVDTDDDGDVDAPGTLYQTPYVMFMDWANSLATRPVTDPQPVETSATLADNWGDAQCFNKENGEAEWEIYKVKMDNPDFYYLTNLTGAFDQLGLVVGTNPGEVSNLGNLESVLADGQKVVADSAYDKAAAAAAALAKEIAAVTSLEKNPMVEGVYQIVSANPDFKAKQNVEKAIYAHVDEAGTITFGWKTIEQDNNQFYFHFTKSENANDLEAGGTVEEGQGDLVYNIRAIATYEPETPYYVGEADAQSTPIELFADALSDYLVLNATGSAFTLRLAGKGAGFSLHANQHGGGTGQSSNLVYWDGAAGASQWYLRKVDYETSIDDLVTEGTEVVSVAYYTTAGAAIPAPAKGINIVVTTYANGVVEAKKVLVK